MIFVQFHFKSLYFWLYWTRITAKNLLIYNGLCCATKLMQLNHEAANNLDNLQILVHVLKIQFSKTKSIRKSFVCVKKVHFSHKCTWILQFIQQLMSVNITALLKVQCTWNSATCRNYSSSFTFYQSRPIKMRYHS